MSENNEQFVYAGYVQGEILDERVNAERTAFSLLESTAFPDEVDWKKLLESATDEVGRYLQPFTKQVAELKDEQIRTYIETKAPQYRVIYKRQKDKLNRIPPNLTEDKLELELYRVNQSYDAELKEKSEELISKFKDNGQKSVEDFKKEYETFLEEWNEAGVDKLARHVVHRRATLEFLDQARGLSIAGKYDLEEVIHETVCPLRHTSDDLRSDQMNLWIIDERLAFHEYLSSDVPFKDLKKEIASVESSDRADILIFDTPTAFVGEEAPYSSVVIIEFKRPARDNYTASDNPIAQVSSYVRKIRDSKAVDRKGKRISVPSSLPFYIYIIADVTPSLRELAENSGFTISPGGDGYFWFNPNLNAYIEIISLEKLIGDARKRNKFFFTQLFTK